MPCTADVRDGFARAGLVIGILVAGPALAANPADPPRQPAPGSASAVDLKSDGPTQPAKLQDGQYTDANGDPTYHVTDGGKKDVNASQELVMPAFGDNRNVMCYMPDIYTYLRARSDGAVGRNRPAEHEPKPAAFAKAEDACMK